MKIVIFGLAKSGTTALFYKIKNSLSSDTICLFEPRAFDPRCLKREGIKSLFRRRREPDVLAKVLPFRPHDAADVDSFSHFEKQILIVRDPRDRLISRLLYGVYHSDFCQHDDKVRAFLELLEQKEIDPRSVPLKTILATFARLNGEGFSFSGWAASQECHSIRKPLDFSADRVRLFLFKYEDMVDRRFGSLEKYLGVPLKGQAAVAPEFARVIRTRNYGSWRDWFTSEDVEYLRPVVQPFLDRYYPEAAWELSQAPCILAEFGSRYVEQIVNERRASLMLPPYAAGSTTE
jgi:hypothetical protein